MSRRRGNSCLSTSDADDISWFSSGVYAWTQRQMQLAVQGYAPFRDDLGDMLVTKDGEGTNAPPKASARPGIGVP